MKEMASSTDPLPQNGSVSFRPHARLIRLLGDELISDEVMAVVELVKNGYDADASQIQMTLENITNPLSGSISIRDDGDGMNLFTLLHVWMEPATTHKRKQHRRQHRTTRGRTLLGEKGVGRFAADKLGSELELVTRDPSSGSEIVLQVFWHHFDDEDKYLEDIRSNWYMREPVEFPGEQHGTLLKIRSLRTAWTEGMMNRLYNGLSRLISPFTEKNDFEIKITGSEFPEMQGTVVNHLLETAPYRLSGSVDKEGYFSTEQLAQPVDLRTLNLHYFMAEGGTKRSPLCGSFRISLNVWDLDLLPGKGNGIDRSLRDSIRASCGVSIYRDSFRIWPYGERDDDWLELNQRRVNNPTLRVSNNQIIGFIEITHDENPELKDRTSREGLIDTPAFFDLKALVLATLSLLETERFNERHQMPLSRTIVEEEKDELLSYLSRIDGQQQQNRNLRNTMREIEQLYRQRQEQERERYDRVSVLAGVGMSAELLSEAVAREVDQTVTLLRTLQGEAQVGANPDILPLVEKLARHMDLLQEHLAIMDPLYHPQQHLNESVDIRSTIYDVLMTMQQRLIKAGIQVSLEGYQGEALVVRTCKGYLMQALIIVITNSLDALNESVVDEPRLAIRMVAQKEFSGILIANNGPLIPEQHRKLIFEPSFSTRKAGRGLGLHVARDLLASCGCTLELAGKDVISPLPGPCFRIRFDRRKITKSVE